MRRFVLFTVLLLMGTTAHRSSGQMMMHQPAIHFELAADSVEVPMSRVDGRIVLKILVDGKGPFPFIFDTGAQGSVIDLGFAREQGLALGQEVKVGSPGGAGRQGYLVKIGRIEIGGLTLNDLSSIAFDGMPFRRGADSPRGVLGPYSLSGLLITLDYPAEKMVFRRGELPKPDEREVFGWSRGMGLPEIPAAVAGQPVVVHLDSGASGSVSLPNDFAGRLPLAGPLVDNGYAKTVDQVQPIRGAALKGNFTMGRYTLENPTLRFVDLGSTGNVGAAMLSQFAITIDPANRRIRLAGPADGKLVVSEERKPRYGIQFEALAASPIVVKVVDPGSPAEKAGISAGYSITRMNGRPVEELGIDQRLEALKASPLLLTLVRGKSTLEARMVLEP